MTSEEQIICKYKFEDKEKFNGKPYCTCFNELCEDLSFVCDNNCQIYEDFKQLARKAQECEELISEKDFYLQKVEVLEQELGEIKALLDISYEAFDNMFDLWGKKFAECDRYRKALEEIEKELKEDVYCESQECGCDDFEECLNCVKTQILDIINKGKGEE